jgi:hypothetical protein
MTEGPRILIFDIETAPVVGYVWQPWKTNLIAIKEDWYLLSFAYKWLGEDTTYYHQKAARKGDDRVLTKQLHSLLDRADIVVAHNLDKFDLRKANARFLYHDLPPVSPIMQIDTLKEAKRYFANTYNSLNGLGELLEVGAKKEHSGFSLWLGCMENDEEAWARMAEYNIEDVELLERVYLRLRPYMGTPGKKGHPNLGFWNPGETTCPKCGGTELTKRGKHRTTVSEFQTYQCKTCGGYSRVRTRDSQADGRGVRLV